MRHTFDLSGSGMQRFGFFPEATAAMTIPATRPDTLSVLVWGVVFREPELDEVFCRHLVPDVRAFLPNQLYLAGWGVLTFHNVCRGEVTISPYRQVLLSKNHEFLTDPEGKPVTLFHAWPGTVPSDAREYLLSVVLEQPFGFRSLKIVTAGPVQLTVDPREVVTEDQFLAEPERYAHDSERVRLLRSLAAS